MKGSDKDGSIKKFIEDELKRTLSDRASAVDANEKRRATHAHWWSTKFHRRLSEAFGLDFDAILVGVNGTKSKGAAEKKAAKTGGGKSPFAGKEKVTPLPKPKKAPKKKTTAKEKASA